MPAVSGMEPESAGGGEKGVGTEDAPEDARFTSCRCLLSHALGETPLGETPTARPGEKVRPPPGEPHSARDLVGDIRSGTDNCLDTAGRAISGTDSCLEIIARGEGPPGGPAESVTDIAGATWPPSAAVLMSGIESCLVTTGREDVTLDARGALVPVALTASLQSPCLCEGAAVDAGVATPPVLDCWR